MQQHIVIYDVSSSCSQSVDDMWWQVQ